MRKVHGLVEGKKVWMVLEDRKCEICGVIYEPYTQDARCCSRKCYRKSEYKRKKEQILADRKRDYEKNKPIILAKNREYYQKHQEERREYRKKYYANNREELLSSVEEYNDEQRHGGRRKELIGKYGHTCYLCGKTEVNYLAAHHITLNNKEHEKQVLLCPTCHGKLHAIVRWGKDVV